MNQAGRGDIPSAYVRDKRTPPPSSDELRARIPGWGVDLNPTDRPAYPKLQHRTDTGAHWDFPERQPEEWPRERSVEHAFVTPVFGTAQPPRGLSGVIRRYSYARFSEGRLAHWLLLVAADRVDAAEHRLRSFASTRPDVPATGLRSEFTRGGLRSRRGRSDARHHLVDPLVVAGPWVAAAGAALVGLRTLARGRR
ncbi:hypothetical protein JKP75_06315 [Blastococcus sp. TML/M2B]|uniref:hypothetical protein n=1 Tax=unclassified Blastococcus TaxID=2619396 RepID=UPI00190AB6FC|nr:MULTISPECIES: hypothetical protein [unclassified Blastococcus]MBN1092212.1 hypothetical protein [Blastococcus sp. TML/M2B]MBN1097684.1 hypothetical protein [Blastococcus sp. TML/C7B]